MGKKHKGETMGGIERDDPSYIDWIVGDVDDKPDILAAAKAMQAKRGAPAEGKHWITGKEKTFWPWTHSLNGMEPDQVHEALGNVASVKDYPGTEQQAANSIIAWAVANLGYVPPSKGDLPPDPVDPRDPQDDPLSEWNDDTPF